MSVSSLALALFVLLRIAPLGWVLTRSAHIVLPWSVRLAALASMCAGLMPWIVSRTASPSGAGAFVFAALAEVALGIALALLVAVPLLVAEYAASVLDGVRADAPPVSPLSAWLRVFALAVFAASGGLRAAVRVAAGSLEALPPGHAGAWLRAGGVLTPVLRGTSAVLEGGLALAASACMALVAAELALAFAARVSPAVSRMGLAVPVRALVPVAVLAGTLGAWTGALHALARQSLEAARALYA